MGNLSHLDVNSEVPGVMLWWIASNPQHTLSRFVSCPRQGVVYVWRYSFTFEMRILNRLLHNSNQRAIPHYSVRSASRSAYQILVEGSVFLRCTDMDVLLGSRIVQAQW